MSEKVKNGRNEILGEVKQIILKFWKTKTVLEDWNQIDPLYSKQDTENFS